jgi:uncharacterized membrane protein HdeD (DUF308 family)
MSTTTTTPTREQAPAVSSFRQSLRERPGLRYALTGVILLIIAVPQMFFARTPASSGHYIIAAFGLALLVAGAVTHTRSPRR